MQGHPSLNHYGASLSNYINGKFDFNLPNAIQATDDEDSDGDLARRGIISMKFIESL